MNGKPHTAFLKNHLSESTAWKQDIDQISNCEQKHLRIRIFSSYLPKSLITNKTPWIHNNVSFWILSGSKNNYIIMWNMS